MNVYAVLLGTSLFCAHTSTFTETSYRTLALSASVVQLHFSLEMLLSIFVRKKHSSWKLKIMDI